jgi:hypothetical protein
VYAACSRFLKQRIGTTQLESTAWNAMPIFAATLGLCFAATKTG